MTFCQDGYVLSSDGSICEKTCGLDEYLALSHFDDVEENLIIGAICTACDSSCKTCSDGSEDSCSSCNEGKYLSRVDIGGNCIEKTSAIGDGSDDITILVLNSAKKDTYADFTNS